MLVPAVVCEVDEKLRGEGRAHQMIVFGFVVCRAGCENPEPGASTCELENVLPHAPV